MESQKIAEDLARELEGLTGDAIDEFVEECLELVVIFRLSVGNKANPDPSGVELLVSYGGPSTRVTSRMGSDYLTISVNWWDDSYETRAYAPGLANYLNDVADCHQELNNEY